MNINFKINKHYILNKIGFGLEFITETNNEIIYKLYTK